MASPFCFPTVFVPTSETVQKSVSDWSTFEKTAKTMKDSGYFMVSGFDDTFRVFSNNVSSPWVVDGKVVIDDNIMNWVSQTKTFTDNGYNNKYIAIVTDTEYRRSFSYNAGAM